MTPDVTCRCSFWKQSGLAFCHVCYGKLPPALQTPLRYGAAAVFGEAYESAVRFLDAREREQERKRAALTFDPAEPKAAKSIP